MRSVLEEHIVVLEIVNEHELALEVGGVGYG
jgi:hypothetical protein